VQRVLRYIVRAGILINYEYSKIVYAEFPGLPELHLYPNPTQDFVIIHFADVDGMAAFSLYNYLGQEVYQSNWLADGEAEFTLSLGNFLPGIYVYQMDDGNDTKTGKLIVK